MQRLKDKVVPYKNKWINIHLNTIDKSKDFYLYVTLHNEKDNMFNNIGHLGIKYEASGLWKIMDFEINRQYRGQNYGLAMFSEALTGIRLLNQEKDVYVYGEIPNIYIGDSNKYQTITESKDYCKLKEFYQNINFDFINDKKFYKQLNVTSISEWQENIQKVMEIKDLKIETAFKDIILESYEKEMSEIKSSILGRYIIKRVENKS